MRAMRVLLVDDHPIVLEGMGHLLQTAEDFEVVGETTSAAVALALAEDQQPELVVLDVHMPGVSTPALCRQLQRVATEAKVVTLFAHEDQDLLRRCLDANVAGVLLKDAQGFDLLHAFRRVLAGELVIDHRVLSGYTPSEPMALPGRTAHLCTARERDVLRLLARGLTSREIADSLALKTNTVRTYTQSLLWKLQAHNRVEAVAIAGRLELL